MTEAGSAGPYCAMRRKRIRRWAIGTGVALVVTIGTALVAGAVDTSLAELPALLLAPFTGTERDDPAGVVLWAIRIPRVVLGLLVGAVLAISGAALQGVFRNPLADPGLVGVSAGAALAAATTTVIGGTFLPTLVGGAMLLLVLPVAAFGGALLATVLVLTLSRRHGRTDVTTMLLIGIAINALASAGTASLMAIATDAQLRSISFWLLGSLGGATWELLFATAPVMVLALLLLPRYARSLDLLLLGESEAAHLGVRVDIVKQRVVLLVALGVGAAVAASGLIGFVGLVVPHAVRLVLGPSHRHLLPLSAALGAVVLVVADTAARTLFAPIELPIGAMTAALGAPVFLHLVVRTRRQAALA